MKAGAIAFLMFGLIALYFGVFSSNQSREIKEAKSQVLAINFAVFRNAVHQYVHHNQLEAVGEITFNNFSRWVPHGWLPMRDWKAQVENGICYVYGQADTDEIEAIRVLYKGSFALGRNDTGSLVPSHNAPMPVPNFIPHNAVVSMTEVRP